MYMHGIVRVNLFNPIAFPAHTEPDTAPARIDRRGYGTIKLPR